MTKVLLYIDKYYHKRGYIRAQATTGRNWLIYENSEVPLFRETSL